MVAQPSLTNEVELTLEVSPSEPEDVHEGRPQRHGLPSHFACGSQHSGGSDHALRVRLVLIWINGAFGAGKTQVAFELQRRLSGAHVADPELAGFGLQKMLPSSHRADFQDMSQWRSVVIATLRQIDMTYEGPLIVPMTIVRTDYFDEIIGGLRNTGVEVRHYALIASRQTLRRRLRQRSGYLVGRTFGRDETWAMQQIDRCVGELESRRFALHVPTDEATIDEIVESIARDAELPLTAPRLSRPRYQLRRLAVGVRHIRL
jgi:hypothetical protein